MDLELISTRMDDCPQVLSVRCSGEKSGLVAAYLTLLLRAPGPREHTYLTRSRPWKWKAAQPIGGAVILLPKDEITLLHLAIRLPPGLGDLQPVITQQVLASHGVVAYAGPAIDDTMSH